MENEVGCESGKPQSQSLAYPAQGEGAWQAARRLTAHHQSLPLSPPRSASSLEPQLRKPGDVLDRVAHSPVLCATAACSCGLATAAERRDRCVGHPGSSEHERLRAAMRDSTA